MTGEKFSQAIGGNDWNKNVSEFIKDDALASRLEAANLRLAVWARQFETADHANPALSFVREMQTAGHYVVTLVALALYKPAAASMRNMVEAALFYSYFRTHPVELATLVRRATFYVEKRDVLEFHRQHTPNFMEHQEKLGLITKLNNWYSDISGIIHGQIPGVWVSQASINSIKHVSTTKEVVAGKFFEAEDVIYRLFLCTVGLELWDNFSTASKRHLLKGLSGDVKATLRLDAA